MVLFSRLGTEVANQCKAEPWEKSYRSSMSRKLIQQTRLLTVAKTHLFDGWPENKHILHTEACLIEVGSLISWWMSPAQRSRFPLLSSMAIDIFSISAMSSETERVFSGAKHTISDERSSLHIDTIKALECLKSWFRARTFTQDDLSQALHEQLGEV